MQISVADILAHKMPGRHVPAFLVHWLERLIHQDELNQALHDYADLRGLDFIEAVLRQFRVSCATTQASPLHIERPVLFVSNHPLGGMDGMIIAAQLMRQFPDRPLRIFVNDLLMYMEPLRELFLPISKTGRQSRQLSALTHEAYQAEQHLLTFPAGACSRLINGEVQDLAWQKNCIQMAVRYQRDIVPLYFDGRNSMRFYRLAQWRKRLHIPFNIEMLFLVDEMFRQQGQHFTLRMGEPIPYSTFDASRTPKEWAQWLRQQSLTMGTEPHHTYTTPKEC